MARNALRSTTTSTAAAAREIDFAHLWRQLRAAGLKSRRPRGLETEWTYINEEGGVFVGDQAVVIYALETGLIDVDSEHEIEPMPSPLPTIETGEEEDIRPSQVRPSQIDTSVSISASQMDKLFGSPCPSNDVDEGPAAPLSQSAVARAFDLSQSVLEGSISEERATRVRLRDGETATTAASSICNDQQRAEAESGTESHARYRRSAQASRRALIDVKDVNYVEDDEDADDYESLASGNESEGDGYYDVDEEVVRRDRWTEDQDVIEDDDAERLDENFLAGLHARHEPCPDHSAPQIGPTFLDAIGGAVHDDLLDRDTLAHRKQTLRTMLWTPPSPAFETSAQSYPGLIESEARPVTALRLVSGDPLQSLFYFMPKSMWVEICEETNRYNDQQVNPRAIKIREKQAARRDGRVPDSLKVIRRRLRAKPVYRPEEILHALGLLVSHTLCNRQYRFAAHWTMTDDGAIPAGIFGRYMSRNRRADLFQDLHFADNDAPNPRDKLWKLRRVYNKLQERFRAGWKLPAVLSFDEGVLPATSKRNNTRMFMPDKPHRYGSKMFMTCDSRTAYCHRFEIYVGKRETRDTEMTAFDNKTGAAAVVRNLKAVFSDGR